MKIAILGPECSGKTTLADEIAREMNWPLVMEYAREFLKRGSDYSDQDLLTIAREQYRRWTEISGNNLVADTEMIVIKVWSQVKFGICHWEIENLVQQQQFDRYLLTYPDLDWVEDDLRECPDWKDRRDLFSRYEDELKKLNASYTVIKGHGPDRLELALNHIRV